MAIIEEYAAIAKRLRELQPVSSQTSQEIDQDKWRNLAEQTARDWVQTRRSSDLVRRVISSRKIRGVWKREPPDLSAGDTRNRSAAENQGCNSIAWLLQRTAASLRVVSHFKSVTPAKAGVQGQNGIAAALASRLRGNDDFHLSGYRSRPAAVEPDPSKRDDLVRTDIRPALAL
jgi:hypothetical protein